MLIKPIPVLLYAALHDSNMNTLVQQQLGLSKLIATHYLSELKKIGTCGAITTDIWFMIGSR